MPHPMADRDAAGLPTVSVCITNYNYARYVADAIESCLSQSYRKCEIVVVDDGSVDDSPAVLEAYADRATIVRQTNAGQTRAALRALSRCHGSIVIFLDADDLLDRDVVDRVVAAFRARPDAARVQWRLRLVGPNGEPTAETIPPTSFVMPDGDLRAHVLRRRTYVWPPTSGNAYARWALDEIAPHVDPDTSAIDFALAETTALIGPVVNLGGTGASYRWHDANKSAHDRRSIRFLHRKIDGVVLGHGNLRRVAASRNIACPSDPRRPRDWAFAQYRLASLRADPAAHPIAGDHVLPLAVRGAFAVATQPSLSARARAKRVAWFAAIALAPRPLVGRLLDRTVWQPPVKARLVRTAANSGAASRDGAAKDAGREGPDEPGGDLPPAKARPREANAPADDESTGTSLREPRFAVATRLAACWRQLARLAPAKAVAAPARHARPDGRVPGRSTPVECDLSAVMAALGLAP